MEIDSKVLAYWQHCARLHALVQSQPEQTKQHWQLISQAECLAGNITDSAKLDLLCASGNLMVIAPQVALRQDQYFIPYYLLVAIDEHGKFIAKDQYALPVIPKAVVEGAELQPVVLGAFDAFENHFVIDAPSWHDQSEQLTWQVQLQYAQQMLSTVTENLWIQELQQLDYTLLAEAIIFPLTAICPEQKYDVSILQNEGAVELIATDRNSGKSAYAQSLITDAWVEAAVKMAPPPQYVWMQYGTQPVYAKLHTEECLSETDDISVVHTQLKHKFNVYYKGKQLLTAWQNVANALQDQYAEYDGPNARLQQIDDALEQAKAERRALQVILSIWERQVEQLPHWSLNIIPGFKSRRLQRLYKFFAQHLPAEDVRNLDQDQMQQMLEQKINRAQNNESVVADMLQQIQQDMQQEITARNKLDQWQAQHSYNIASNVLWEEIVALAQHYWALHFAVNPQLQAKFAAEPDIIDKLIVENAEYITPMQGAVWLSKAQRAVIMGSYDSIVTPNFSTHIDYAVARSFGLVECDSDFEDLQFAGVLGSVGNLWGLASGGCEVDRVFEHRADIELQYTIINTEGVSQQYAGSWVNRAEIAAIMQFLQQPQNAAQEIAIYTAFSAQRHCLRDALQAAGLSKVKVYLLQEPHFAAADLIIFSPVYTSSDPGPYSFDRGSTMLENMIANARRKLIIFGDKRIFKPQLHSAAGKFAKLFIQTEVVSV